MAVTAAKRVLRYLSGTVNLGLVFTSSGEINLVGYADADYAGDVDTSRSTTGYVFYIGGSLVCWQSRLQPTVALSSTESEYMAAGAAAQELMWLRELLREIGFEQHGSTSIYEDNRSCINLSENPMFHKRTKHILVRYHYIFRIWYRKDM